jgi:hypothetical protein
MAAALKQLRFDVVEGYDLDKAAMDQTIRNFAEARAGAHVGLFFYAGHGLQVNGQNYLVPVDAKLASALALDFEMVRLDVVQRTMEQEATTNIIVLDACRDNPLARNLARALGTRSASIGRGLAAMESGEGTLISFSTQPGNVALDGTGRNSPFASALLKHIAAPGEDLPTILINVRNDVMAATGRRQVPWEHSALTAKVYFIPPKPTAEVQVELAFWNSVKDSTSPTVLGTYLQRYPAGEFAPIARALIEHYEHRLQLETATRDQDLKRQEELKKAAEVTRLEAERRGKEVALAEERARAERTKDSAEAKRVEEEQRAQAAKAALELSAAQEQAREAREAAKLAEDQRVAAVKAADEATKAAEVAIAKRREAEKTKDPVKVAALPKIEKAPTPRQFNGNWTVTWRSQNCPLSSGSYNLRVTNGVIEGDSASGRISANGAVSFTRTALGTAPNRGIFRGNSGSGTFRNLTYNCSGTFTARRN